MYFGAKNRIILFIAALFLIFTETKSQQTQHSLFQVWPETSLQAIRLQNDTLWVDGLRKDTTRSWAARKLFLEHAVIMDEPELKLLADPLFNFYGGTSSQKETTLYRNTRGVQVNGKVGNHLTFHTSFYETQLNQPDWTDQYIRKFRVVPGETNPKGYGEDGYDIGSVYGSFTWKQHYGPWTVAFSMGYDEFFIGNGYRSVFISDAGMPYYFGAATVRIKSLTLHHITHSLQDPNFNNVMNLPGNREKSSAYQKKTMTTHLLTWQPARAFSVSLFESTVFAVSDSSETRFSLNYINPLPLVNSINYGLGGKNNVALGFQMGIKPFESWLVYGQYLFDDKGTNSQAWQAGLKHTTKYYYVVAEYNSAGRDVYQHRNVRQGFTHFNQPIAHPNGNDFEEWIFMAGSRINRFMLKTKVNLLSSAGNHIFALQEATTQRQQSVFYEGGIFYLLNPNTNLHVFADWMLYQNPEDQREHVFRFGIRTQIRNEYRDIIP